MGASTSTGIRHQAFEDTGSAPVLLKDSQGNNIDIFFDMINIFLAGMVPLSCLKNLGDTGFPPRKAPFAIEERGGGVKRFQLP